MDPPGSSTVRASLDPPPQHQILSEVERAQVWASPPPMVWKRRGGVARPSASLGPGPHAPRWNRATTRAGRDNGKWSTRSRRKGNEEPIRSSAANLIAYDHRPRYRHAPRSCNGAGGSDEGTSENPDGGPPARPGPRAAPGAPPESRPPPPGPRPGKGAAGSAGDPSGPPARRRLRGAPPVAPPPPQAGGRGSPPGAPRRRSGSRRARSRPIGRRWRPGGSSGRSG